MWVVPTYGMVNKDVVPILYFSSYGRSLLQVIKKAKSTTGGEYFEYVSPDDSVGKLYSKKKAEENGYDGFPDEDET